MKLISLNLQQDADLLKIEIESDTSDWFWPVSNEHQIFEQAYMKFVNRNLNYFNFYSMVAQTLEGNEFNNNLPKTLQFCEKVRTLTKNKGPFGRMCVWKIPPKHKLLPHKDEYRYHFNIIRNIFVISENPENKLIIKINDEPAPCQKGTLFQFAPATELHEFMNNSDDDFYFLGFDYWYVITLNRHLQNYDIINGIINNSTRCTEFGGNKTEYKYMSKH